MNKKERKELRKVLIKNRVPSEAERQSDLEKWEEATQKKEYYDLDYKSDSLSSEDPVKPN